MLYIDPNTEEALRENWRTCNFDADPLLRLKTATGKTVGLLHLMDDAIYGLFHRNEASPILTGVPTADLDRRILEGSLALTRIADHEPQYPLSVYSSASKNADCIVEDLNALTIASEQFERTPDLREPYMLKLFSVQCLQGEYKENVVTLLGVALDDALTRAVRHAQDSSDWKTTCENGPIFIGEASETINQTAIEPEHKLLPIPSKFRELGEPPTATVVIENGQVHAVDVCGKPCRIVVNDYDQSSVVGTVPFDAKTDDAGRPYVASYWGDWN